MILKLRDSHVASLEKKREDIRELNRDELVVCVCVSLSHSLCYQQHLC